MHSTLKQSMRTGVRSTIAGIAALLLALVQSGCADTKNDPKMSEVDRQRLAAAEMVEKSAQRADSILKHSQTEGFRNMLGGVRGVFIAPAITGGAAFVGLRQGTGYLMRRHGKDWSDPVFFRLTDTSAGFQFGAKVERTIILLMTDPAVDNFADGQMTIGATGGMAIGPTGVGGSGAGGVSGGLEEIILTSNEGVFIGGGWSGIQPKPEKTINDDIYGPNTDIRAVLDRPGGDYAPAREIRAKLTQMVLEAWDTSHKTSPPTTFPAAPRVPAPSKLR
jgi:lipid-binding SYLF domain-containing protein